MNIELNKFKCIEIDSKSVELTDYVDDDKPKEGTWGGVLRENPDWKPISYSLENILVKDFITTAESLGGTDLLFDIKSWFGEWSQMKFSNLTFERVEISDKILINV